MSSLKIKLKNGLISAIAPLSRARHQRQTRVRVIDLHDIPGEREADFILKMEWLKKNFNMISLASAYDRVGLTNNKTNIALTFDDGFKEHSTFVAPVLRDLLIPATFFVSSGGLGAKPKFASENLKRMNGRFAFMDANDVKYLAVDPLFTIGGHTMNHTDLGRNYSAADLEKEIKHDKKDLEKAIGKKIEFFAYPFGSIKNLHRDSIAVIRDSGYKAAFTIVPSFWKQSDDPYQIGRDSLLLEDSIALWNACLSGGYDAISKFKSLITAG
jgi:peptidoglycan/xylan/chitin deacetylase (PgdA/CDA1 family)